MGRGYVAGRIQCTSCSLQERLVSGSRVRHGTHKTASKGYVEERMLDWRVYQTPWGLPA